MSKLIEGRIRGTSDKVFLDYNTKKGSWEIYESSTKRTKYLSGDLSEIQARAFLERKYPRITFKRSLEEERLIEKGIKDILGSFFGKKDVADFTPEELGQVVQNKVNQSKEMAKKGTISYETEFLNNLWLVLRGMSSGNRELKGNRPVSYVLILKPESDGSTTIIKGHGPLTISKTKLPFSKDDKDYISNEKSIYNLLIKNYGLKTSSKNPELPVVMKCKDPDGKDCVAFLGKQQSSSDIISKAIGSLLKANKVSLGEEGKLTSLKGYKIIKGLSPDAGSEGRNVHFPATKEELESGITMIAKYFEPKDIVQAVQKVADGDITPEELNQAATAAAKDGNADIMDKVDDLTGDSDENKDSEEPKEDENKADIYGILTGDNIPSARFKAVGKNDDYTVTFKGKKMEEPNGSGVEVDGEKGNDPDEEDELRAKIKKFQKALKGKETLKGKPAFLGSSSAIMSQLDYDDDLAVDDTWDLYDKDQKALDLDFDTDTGEITDEAFETKKLVDYTPDDDYLDEIKDLFKSVGGAEKPEDDKKSDDKKDSEEKKDDKDSKSDNSKTDAEFLKAIEDKTKKDAQKAIAALPDYSKVDTSSVESFKKTFSSKSNFDKVDNFYLGFNIKAGEEESKEFIIKVIPGSPDGIFNEVQTAFGSVKELRKALSMIVHPDKVQGKPVKDLILEMIDKIEGMDSFELVNVSYTEKMKESYKRDLAINRLLKRINKVL